MSLLECRLSLLFDRLFIPILEINECVLEIQYEDKRYRFKYPQEIPHLMPLIGPLTREKNVMTLVIMVRVGKKYRKIAKGTINLYKKYFLSEKLTVDKWIYLALYETQLEEMTNKTNIMKTELNTGKIFMKAQLLDPELEDEKYKQSAKGMFDNLTVYTATTHASVMTQKLRNALKNLPNTKDKITSNKTERFRSVTEHGNEFLKNIKKTKGGIQEDIYEDIEDDEPQKKVEEFNDGLTDVSISIIDGTEENHLEINKLNLEIDTTISKVKSIFEENSEQILPSDPKKLKEFLENLSSQIRSISDNYAQNLQTINSINKRIKFQGKDYYDRYKAIKKTFTKDRRDLLNKNKMLEFETKQNVEANNQIGVELGEVKNEISYFKDKLGLGEATEIKDEDTLIIMDILNCLRSTDVDITSDLSAEQREYLEMINKKCSPSAIVNNENQINLTEDEYVDDDKIIGGIEKIVNEHYKNGLIFEIKIDQVSATTYKFNDVEATLFFEGDELKVKQDGTNFVDWVLANFGMPQERPAPTNSQSSKKKITQPQSNSSRIAPGKPLEKKIEDKKSVMDAKQRAKLKFKCP